LKNNEVNSKIQQLESKSLLNIEEELKLQPNPYNFNMYSVKADGLSVKFININSFSIENEQSRKFGEEIFITPFTNFTMFEIKITAIINIHTHYQFSFIKKPVDITNTYLSIIDIVEITFP
jgi:hypothetical protein